MTETVGTTSNFNMPVDEIIEMALEAIGGEHISHKEAKHARMALNLTFIDLQNRAGMAPLSSIKITEVALASGSANNYQLSAGVNNVLDAVIEVSTDAGFTDLPIERLSYTEYLEIPTKETSKGRPTHYLVDRQRDNIQVTFWPVPKTNNYTFKMWGSNKIADVDKSFQLVDLPSLYLPAIIKGLRYYMGDLRGLPLDERMYMKNEYMETLQYALDQDRERVNFDIYPSNRPQLGT